MGSRCTYSVGAGLSTSDFEGSRNGERGRDAAKFSNSTEQQGAVCYTQIRKLREVFSQYRTTQTGLRLLPQISDE